MRPADELPFLGVSIRMTDEGMLLHQHHYTQDFLREHSSHISVRKRTTSGEPEHFRRETPLLPDPSNSEHQEWVKIGQKILGGLLWLSTRTRPDLSYSVSLLRKSWPRMLNSWRWSCDTFCSTSTLHKPSDCSTHTLGMERWLTLLFTAMLLLHSGNTPSLGTQSISLSVISVISFTGSQWERLRSPRAELYALATARKSARNFRLLIHEPFTSSMVMSLRRDNTAAIAMLEEAGWRTRYISISGEAIRQEMLGDISYFDSCLYRSSTSRSANKTNIIFQQFDHLPMRISELYS